MASLEKGRLFRLTPKLASLFLACMLLKSGAGSRVACFRDIMTRQARGLGRRAVVAAAGCPGARVCGGGKSSVVVDLTVVGQCGRGALRAEQLPEESATTLTSRRSRDSIGWAASSVGLGKPSAAPPRAAPHGRQNRGRNQKGRRGHRK